MSSLTFLTNTVLLIFLHLSNITFIAVPPFYCLLPEYKLHELRDSVLLLVYTQHPAKGLVHTQKVINKYLLNELKF